MKIKAVIGITFAICTVASTAAYLYTVKKINDYISNLDVDSTPKEFFNDEFDDANEEVVTE